MVTAARKDLPNHTSPNWGPRVTEELRVLMGRAGNGRALTAKDLIDSGIARTGAGGGLVPVEPGSGGTESDLTPPPAPTGFAVRAGLTTVFVEHDAPVYTQGRGHDRTVVYGVLQSGSAVPTFDQAVVLFQFQGTIGAYPAALGTRYRLWIKWQSMDGVQSASPAGGTNGLDVQTGKIGNNDLGPLVVEAGNLANNAVTAAKLAAQAVDATKFASGIEPVGIVASGDLPTVKSTSTIVYGGKLYRWDGSKYTAATAAADVTGQIGATQISDGAISTPKLAANAVTATAIAAGAITAAKLAVDSVTAAAIAAGAVRAEQIAAGAITASKMVISDTSTLVPDAEYTDLAMWAGTGGAVVSFRLKEPSQNAGTASGSALQISKGSGAGVDDWGWGNSKRFPVKYAAQYRVRGALWSNNAADTRRVVVRWFNTGGVQISAVVLFTHTGTGWITYSVDAIPPANAVTAEISFGMNGPSVSLYMLAGKCIFSEKADAELIVDGAITATKIAANAIAVGTAAIQDGAIVNAMIGNLSADKITAGVLAAARIAAGSIDATKLAANSVTATQLAANAVTAGKIAANAVTAATIAAGAITAAKLAAKAVTADKIDVVMLSAVAANMGTLTAGRIQNAANTTFIDLNASGATRAIQFGSDLVYSETGGLVINKLNVIQQAQLAPGSVSQEIDSFSAGPYAIWRNNTFNTVLTVDIPAGRTLLISGAYEYVFSGAEWGAELRIDLNGTLVKTIPLLSTPIDTFLRYEIPCLIVPAAGSYNKLNISVRSVRDSSTSTEQRRIRNISISGIAINR